MLRIVLSTLCLFLISTSIFSAPLTSSYTDKNKVNNLTKDNLTGTYYCNWNGTEGRFIFNSNSSYIHYFGLTDTATWYGTWKLDNNVLVVDEYISTDEDDNAKKIELDISDILWFHYTVTFDLNKSNNYNLKHLEGTIIYGEAKVEMPLLMKKLK